jgi:micrococcal nuclease
MSIFKKMKHIASVISLLVVLFFSVFQVWQYLQNQNRILGETTIEQDNQLGFEKVKVKRVVDGDTIELEDGRKLRYIGIDTPETKHPTKGQECFGEEASQKNKELVEGKIIALEKDVNDTDRYGRLLRYVWLEEKMINLTLVELGLAHAVSYPPDVAHQEEFRMAESQARAYQKGLWGADCDLETKKLEQLNQDIQDADQQLMDNVQGAEDELVEEGCVIKGNISDSGKLYHLPTCPSYSVVKINEDKGEKWFCSEEQAIEAGWQKSSNCP